MQMVRYLWVALLLIAGGAVQAAQTQARLILSAQTARPGETVMAGIHLHHPAGWHTYWRNSGDSGKGTEVRWTLPPGVTADQILWSVPEKEMVADLTSYIYKGDAVLLVPLTLASNLQPGDLELKADVAWLECEKLCLPGKAEVQAKLTIGPASKPSRETDLIADAQTKLPRRLPALTPKAWWGPGGDSRPLNVEWSPVQSSQGADFYPYENDKIEVSGETKILSDSAGAVRLQKIVKKLEGDWPKQMPGLIIELAKDEAPVGYEVKLEIGNAPPAGAAKTPASFQSLLAMLGLAFLGGLILNIMPCVLPVISLKILSFVKQSRDAPGQVRKLGLIYVLGVLLSFLVLAGIVIGIQLAGHSANWGMQFQDAKFLAAMTVLVTLVSFNLFGLFEINLGGRILGTAGELAGQGGASGAFFNGVLAALLATPCTAPVLAPALGFAFSQPPAITAVMFLFIGLGLSAPYLLLSFQPGWLRFLPKPGPWMEKFRILMGFPMLGTAFWLFHLASTHLGKSGTFSFGIFLVVLALASWIWGEFVQRGSGRKVLAMAASGLLVIGAGAYALNQHQGIQWQPWSPQAVAQARASGRPVLVDFTADWCATCQANKKFSLEVASVEAKLKEINAAALLGDYTLKDPAITEELKRFNRAGVPLVLVFPKDSNAPPIVLPELLTPGTVIEALERAAR